MNMEKLISALTVIAKSIKDQAQQKAVMKTLIAQSTGKALDQGTMSLLDQAIAIIQQIAQMTSDGEPEQVEEMQNEDNLGTGEDSSAEKSVNSSTGEDTGMGSTGSDDAETRINDLPDTTADNADSIAKTLAEALQVLNGKGKQVAKSAVSSPAISGEMSAVLKMVGELTNVVKSIKDNQDNMGTVLGDMLVGLGVDKQLEIAQKSVVAKNAPAEKSNDELTAVLKGLSDTLNTMGQKKAPSYNAGYNPELGNARKSFSKAIPALLSK